MDYEKQPPPAQVPALFSAKIVNFATDFRDGEIVLDIAANRKYRNCPCTPIC